MGGQLNPIDGELLVATEGGWTVQQGLLEGRDNVHGRRVCGFCNLCSTRSATWCLKTRNVRLQPGGKLHQCVCGYVLVLLIFSGSFRDDVELLSQFEAAKEHPQREKTPENGAKEWCSRDHRLRKTVVEFLGSVNLEQETVSGTISRRVVG